MSLSSPAAVHSPAIAHPASIPRHVAIIMDGNGRWAKARSKPRSYGHRKGLDAARRVVQSAHDLGISCVSLYTFSTENWKRAEEEVAFLMNLIRDHLRKEYDFYRRNRIRVVHSGDLEGLPAEVRSEIDTVSSQTAHFTGMTVNLAINYGGRNELFRAAKCLAAKLTSGAVQESELDEASLGGCLDTPLLPDVDLLIRTGGEKRISNFMLWQSSYAELYFSDKYWPDWSGDDLKAAVEVFAARERRFGAAGQPEADDHE